MSDSKSRAIDRMMIERDMDEKTATNELKRRIKLAKNVIALSHYVEWAREHGHLQGGPELKTVNYRRVNQIVQRKCYKSSETLQLSVWDLVDLCNTALFNQFRKRSGVQLYLDEILLISPAEYATLRRARASLIKKRKEA